MRAAETLKPSHRPDGKVADVLASTHAFTTANALVNYSGGACLRNLEKFPSPSWECLADMPNLTLAIRLGSNLVLPGMGMCQPCLQIPIALMGKCLIDMSTSILIFYDGCCLELPDWSTCHLRLKLKSSHRSDGNIAEVLASNHVPQLRPTFRSTTAGSCSRDLKFSHRPHGKIADALASTLSLVQLRTLR